MIVTATSLDSWRLTAPTPRSQDPKTGPPVWILKKHLYATIRSLPRHQSQLYILDWVSLGRNLLDDDAEWVNLIWHSLDIHPCERKVSETSFTLVKSLKFIPLGRRRLQFFAITNFIRKPYFPRHLSRNTKFQYLYYTNQNIVFELSIL